MYQGTGVLCMCGVQDSNSNCTNVHLIIGTYMYMYEIFQLYNITLRCVPTQYCRVMYMKLIIY